MIDEPNEMKVLDHGFVRLVDVMGDDARIVQAARVSYGEGTKTIREDAALIDYLMRHAHTSPFEMVEFTVHLKMPLFVAAQHQRHRTASVNQISARYSEMPDEFYVPELDRIQAQSTTNKQGSEEGVSQSAKELFRYYTEEAKERAYSVYQVQLKEHGIARELARINLPQNLYTEMYWKIDLHNLFHYLALRMDSHAQYEIRVYAKAMAAFVQLHCPVAYKAFVEHRLNAKRFSASELVLLRQLVDLERLEELAKESGLRKSRVAELLEKLK